MAAEPRRGVLFMVGATFAFTAMITLVKNLRETMPTLDVMFWRGVVGVPFAFLLARRDGKVGLVRRDLLVLRSVLGTGAMFCFYTATRFLTVADLSFIHKLQPILIAIVAPLILGRGESVGRRVWLVLAAGICGCALLLAPEGGAGWRGGLWGLGAVLFSAGAHITVRKLGETDRPAAVVLWFQILMASVAGLVVVATAGRLPTFAPSLWPMVIGVGLAAVAGQVLLTTAYQLERAAPVAAASYIQAVWALAVDLVIFGVVPTVWGLAGGVLIVMGGLILLPTRE